MKDSHKFKVWDKKRNLMIDYQGTDLDGDPFIFYLGGDGRLRFLTWDDYHLNDAPLDPNDFIVLRCTGLRDKKSILIDEGDILNYTSKKEWKSGDCDRGVVFWHDELARFGLRFYSIYGGEGYTGKTEHIVDYIRKSKVIGNIYEHPHLVEGEEQ